MVLKPGLNGSFRRFDSGFSRSRRIAGDRSGCATRKLKKRSDLIDSVFKAVPAGVGRAGSGSLGRDDVVDNQKDIFDALQVNAGVGGGCLIGFALGQIELFGG